MWVAGRTTLKRRKKGVALILLTDFYTLMTVYFLIVEGGKGRDM